MSSAIVCEHGHKFTEQIPDSALCDRQNTPEPRVDQLTDASQALHSVTVKRRLSHAWISWLMLPSFCTLWRSKHDWATRGSADWRFPGSVLCGRQNTTEPRVDQLTDASQTLHSVTVKTRLSHARISWLKDFQDRYALMQSDCLSVRRPFYLFCIRHSGEGIFMKCQHVQ